MKAEIEAGFTYEKYNDWVFILLPTISIGRDPRSYSMACSWLCFAFIVTVEGV